MALFKVRVRQFIEEVAEIEVEAATPAEALELASNDEDYMNGDLDWSDGGDVKDEEFFSVTDTAGKEVLNILQILKLNGEIV